MKHLFLILFILLFAQQASRAQVVTDTVSVGAGYANQVWYSLANDDQGSAPKNNWDIAFDVSAYGAAIHANTITGTTVWLYAAGDTSDWANLDTNGLSNWPKYYNSDTSWAIGAFNQNPASQFDMGWGIYNSITHFVTGDSLYLIKLANNSYRKIWLIDLGNGAYHFRYANLDNSGDQTVTLTKTNYAGKNFAYYSIQNNAALDREPLNSDWDLLFTQHTAFLPTAYTVAGVLTNYNTTVAQANGVDVTNVQYVNHTFVTPINEIGYDWKVFNSQSFVYDITDSLVYFVQTQNGDIWKMIFTGFGGSANGNYIFTKELISATGLAEGSSSFLMELYPNPASENVMLTFNAKTNMPVRIVLTDLTGKIVYDEQENGNAGLQQYQIGTGNLQAGMYFVTILADGRQYSSKLIIR